ncbi:MAG: alpha-2-macroglobulin, partial [Pirellulales bacterium]|nr:alpha-2-macroglobulin [Pirellulales bacterium]
MTGEPFVGSTVVAIYDKSVEYISGGSNVPDIKAFFWKWRRHHHPRTESSLARWFRNLIKPKTTGMNDLGVFGGTVADEKIANNFDGVFNADLDIPFTQGSYSLAVPQFGAPGRGIGGRSMSKSAPRAEMADGAPVMEEARMLGKGGEEAGGEAPMVEPTVRTKFADTALWVGALTTAKDGTAEVALDMPENLTTWRIKVWGMGQGTRVGQGFTDVVTRKDLIIRLQAPRFFVQTDEVVLSAIVHNYLKSKKSVKVALELDGKCLKYVGRVHRTPVYEDGKVTKIVVSPEGQWVEIAPNGEARVDWRVKVLDEGEAVVRVKALTDEESDAMEQKFPCYIHGMLKMESYSGSIRPKETAGKFTINVPSKRRPEQSRLEVRFSPTLAGAMVDALP